MIAAAAAATFIVTSPAQAQSVTLGVTGTLKPTSCVPALNGGGMLDWGNISTSRIQPEAPTKLDRKQLGFSIKCDGKTPVAIKLVDNRSESAVSGIAFAGLDSVLTDAYILGLGVVGGKGIGSYFVALATATVAGDGAPVASLHRLGHSDTWYAMQPGVHGVMNKTYRYTWGAVESTTPGAFASITGELSVTPFLNKGSELPNENEIALDGSLSLELEYL
jgi:type 1 fimbria pilin